MVTESPESAQDLASRDPTKTHAMLQALSETAEGKRLLREQGPPPLKTVQRWAGTARANALLNRN